MLYAMQQSHSSSLKRFYTMLDNPKTSSVLSMPAASEQGQTSNGILEQDSAMALKDVKKISDTQSNVHAQYVLQLLQLQRQAGFLCDITIHVKDRSFKAHKPLLAACSLYFRALFADVTTRESTALSLTSLTPAGFEVLLDYIYSGSLAITAENSSEVLSAATCLQMTNVVETCLSFMRSSFRMSKHKDALSTKHGQDEVCSRGSIRSHSSEYLTDKNMQRKSSIANNVISPVFKPTTSKARQGNLQILSTRSIDETEYKNIINEPSEHCGIPSTSVTNNIPLHHTAPPQTFAKAKHTSTQLVITSMSNPTRSRQHSRLSSDSDIASEPRSLDSTTGPIFHSISQDQSVKSPTRNPLSSPGLVVDVKTSTAILPDEAHLHLPLSSFNPRASSVKDFSSTNPDAAAVSPPELYSGKVQTARLSDEQNLIKEDRPRKSVGMATSFSSDDQANSVEISSDDDNGSCNAWGVDRYVSSKIRDLSGTPYSASTSKNAHLSQSNDVVRTGSIIKTQSLPSLANAAPHLSLERAHSFDDGVASQVITYEKATKAISALTKTELVSTLNFQSTEFNMESDEQSLSVNSGKTQEGSLNEPIIPSRVLRKTLLPKKSERSSSTPRPPVSITDKLTVVVDDESNDDIKHEANEDTDSGAFPLAESASKTFEFKMVPGLLKTVSDEDSILDLSVPKRQTSRPSSTQPEGFQSFVDSIKNSSRHSSEISTVSDPGMALAADALSLLKQGKTSESNWSTVPELQSLSITNTGQTFEPSDNFLEEANQWNQATNASNTGSGSSSPKQTVYSRKPRRTTGGQTCTWPGCGRLFRHRNIYEEHQRLHELGIPVSQLRKCYMGARVKKTVREQLEELRTNDVFEAGNDGESVGQVRARKRKAISESQEPIRKRVHAKERAPPFQLISHSQSSVVTALSSKPTLPSTPPRVRHSLSHPLSSSHTQPSSFLRAPLPPPLLPNTSLVKVVGPDGVMRWAQRAEPMVETSQRASIVSSGDNAAHTVVQPSLQQQQAVIRLPGLSSQSSTTNATQQIGINPVQQTLALLGIRAPLRRTETGAYGIPVPNVSSDHMRRRLAIRETTATSLRLDPMPPNPTVLSVPTAAAPSFDPDVVRARLVLPREGYQIVTHDATNPQSGAIQLQYTKPHSGFKTTSG